MLLIFGWRGRYSTIGKGQFHCPNERVDRRYRHRRVRRWFTLFFVPLVPLKVLGEFVECASCGASYATAVLSVPTESAMRDNLANALRYAVVAIARADGAVHEAERRKALEILVGLSTTPYSRADLDRDLAELDVGTLERAFARVAGMLSHPSKELLITACLELASADGVVDPGEVREIARAGRALGLSAAHIRGLTASGRSVGA